MSLIQSKYAKGQVNFPYPAYAGAVCAHRFWHQLAVNPTLGDILELAPIPQGTRIIDIILEGDDMDSSTTLVFDVGIMSGDFGQLLNADGSARTIGNEFFAGAVVDQAATVARPTKITAYRTDPTTNDRSIGLKFTAAATAFTTGIVSVTLLYATV